MKQQQIRYGVLIRRKDGTSHIAIDDGGILTKKHRREALKFAADMSEHIPPRRRMKVVKVLVTWEVTE